MRAMKDSGVEWIGEIPEAWELSKIGSLYSLRSEKVSDKDYQPLSVTMKGIVPQLESAAKSDDSDNRKLVKIGDFAINSRSDRRGSCGISRYEGSVSLINTVITPRNNISSGYYDWLFHSVSFADEFYRWGHGIVDDLWTTRWQEMKRIYIPFPPLAEQTAIAEYLDDKCAKIDSIITANERIIAKLKEYKASLITETVTKGLNPDVKMKYIAVINPECKIPNISPDDNVSFVPMECVRNNKRFPKNAPVKQNNSSYSTFNNGDIALAKVTPCFQNGNICVMENLTNGFAFGSSELFNIRPTHIYTKFLLYYLMTNKFISGGIANMTGVAGLQRVSINYLRNVRLPYPSLDKQTTIAAYLDDKCSKIDNNISLRESLISKLTDYKKSLIYEVVTGKKEIES